MCFYVFELLPGQEYAERLLDVVRDLLSPDGMAVIQFKYATADPRSRSRRRAYRRDVASMTTFGIPEFWEIARDHRAFVSGPRPEHRSSVRRGTSPSRGHPQTCRPSMYQRRFSWHHRGVLKCTTEGGFCVRSSLPPVRN